MADRPYIVLDCNLATYHPTRDRAETYAARALTCCDDAEAESVCLAVVVSRAEAGPDGYALAVPEDGPCVLVLTEEQRAWLHAFIQYDLHEDPAPHPADAALAYAILRMLEARRG